MAVKKLVEIGLSQQFLNSVGGLCATELVKICEKKSRPLTDEEIEKHLKIKLTEIRTILNRLHYRGIAMYHKKRNNKTGWYSYTWSINIKRIAELILEQQMEAMAKLEKKAEFESTYSFFMCKKKCSNFPFELAAEYNFNCPECGNTLETIDNKKRLKTIKKEKEELSKEIEELKKFLV
ncbi:MAG: hypothetical protein HYW50_04565 [Candidatus Diapherotrites archaeon]|nr:hypothetical protein [Candidatus Diapherotrites archaeon]